MSNRHKISDAVLNQAEIYAKMECDKLFYRPANEIKTTTERIIRESFINGYTTAIENLITEKRIMKNYKITVTTTITDDATEEIETMARNVENILNEEIINDSDVFELSVLINGLIENSNIMRITLQKGRKKSPSANRYTFLVFYKELSARSRIVLNDAYENNLNSNMMSGIVADFNKYNLKNRVGGFNEGKEEENV